MPTIVTLNLSYNPITSIEELAAFTTLEDFAMFESALGDASLAPLSALESLHTLNLGRNQIPALSGFPALPQLGTLILSYNPITSLDPLPGSTTLTYLGLDDTLLDIEALQALSEKFPNISYLQLRSLDLTSADLPTFPELPALASLVLDDNQLDDMTGFHPPTSLFTLSLKDNSLTAADPAGPVRDFVDNQPRRICASMATPSTTRTPTPRTPSPRSPAPA